MSYVASLLFRSGLLLGIAFLLSTNKRLIPWRTVVVGCLLQHLTAFFFFKTSIGARFCLSTIDCFMLVQSCVDQGASFFFGNLVNGAMPWGAVFAFKVIPAIVFFSALTSVLYYLRVIQYLVWICAKALTPLLGVSGVESLSTLSNAFLSAPEIPLLIRFYLSQLTRSEFFVVMVSGLGTLSASFIPIHASLGIKPLFLLASHCMAISSSLVVAKIMVPSEEKSVLSPNFILSIASPYKRLSDAVRLGAESGLRVITGALASLVSIISCVALINALCAWVCGYSLEQITIPLFSACAWLIGIPTADISIAATALSKKFFIHEIVGFQYLMTQHVCSGTQHILSVALSGFASVSSAGVYVGLFQSLCPEKFSVIGPLIVRSIIAGTLVTYLNSVVVQLYF